MQAWRFFLPSALGFTLKNLSNIIADKLSGAPSRVSRTVAYVAEHSEPGDPAGALRALDKFAHEVRWLMSVGPDKGPLIEELVGRLPANARILELGTYCGYSAIMLTNAFGEQTTLTSVDIDEESIAAATANVAHAGLAHQVQIIHGASSDVLAELEGAFDLVFFDHWKDLYKNDLQLMEERGLLRPGSIVVADNVGDVFSPEEFLGYVRNCGHYQCESRQATILHSSVPDAVEICVYQP